MSRRRPSLMEILAEEQEVETQKAPQEVPHESSAQEPAQKEPTQTTAPTIAPTTAPTTAQSTSTTPSASKADYIRLSVTLPPDVFERLQALSLSRRKAREPYTFCHLARQAIMEWLDRQEQT